MSAISLHILEGEQIVRALGANGPGDGGLAAHGVDGDQRAGQVKALEQGRNGSDSLDFSAQACCPSTSR